MLLYSLSPCLSTYPLPPPPRCTAAVGSQASWDMLSCAGELMASWRPGTDASHARRTKPSTGAPHWTPRPLAERGKGVQCGRRQESGEASNGMGVLASMYQIKAVACVHLVTSLAQWRVEGGQGALSCAWPAAWVRVEGAASPLAAYQ
jgi:hypothetical protein